MVYTPQKYQNDISAQKLIPNSLKILPRLLIAIGKPLFNFLTYSIIFLFSALFLLKQLIKYLLIGLAFVSIQTLIATSKIVGSLFSIWSYIGKKVKKPEKKVKRVYPPRIKFSLSRLNFSKILKNIASFRIPKLKLRYIFLLTILYSITVFLFASWKIFLKDLPSPEMLSKRKIEVSTKIYDRNGVLLYNIYKDKNRTPVSLDEIPLRVRLATLAIEDAEFYQHPGFSIRGIIRAIYKNYQEGELTGGSTITQQLIKNTLLTPEKTYSRKIKEVVLAVQTEHKYSKDQILEMYLNEVSYGGTAYGIQEASRVYFGKDVDKLTLAEAALLAGLPKSPTKYSPFGSNPDLTFNRQKEVLNLMKANGFITQQQLEQAEKENITFTQNRANIKAPHFVMFAREYLENKYGKEVAESGGLEVITTLDYDIQKLAEKAVSEEIEKLSKLNVGNGAVVVINPQTGEILAMVGSKNYFDTQADGNVNVTTRPRQPGSSIKVVNYAYALSHNFTLATIIQDSPVTFEIEGQSSYSPKNYDGKYRGDLTLRSAFAESRNIPAVKVLSTYGVDKMIDMGRKMGITTWNNPSNYGLSLTLGGGEVKLIDLAQVYATVANYGIKTQISPIQKVTNYQGKVLEENKCSPEEIKSRFNIAEKFVDNAIASEGDNSDSANDLASATEEDVCSKEKILDPRVAYLLVDILKDNDARAPAFGRNSLLNIPGHKEVAVKTGTSNDLRDNLTIGFNQNYLVAVWVGNNDNSPMSRVASGITGATPIFNEIMSALLASEQNHDWETPEGLVKVPYCTLTGTLSCTGCPTIRYEWFLEENAPTKACNPEFVKQILEKKKEEEEESTRQGEILEPAASTER